MLAGQMLDKAVEIRDSDDNDVALIQLTRSQLFVLGACQAYFAKVIESSDAVAHAIGAPETYDQWFEVMEDFAVRVDEQIRAQGISGLEAGT